MDSIGLIFITPYNLLSIVVFYVGLRLVAHFKPIAPPVNAILCSLAIACLPLAKAHLKNFPLIFFLLSALLISLFIIAVVVDTRAFLHRKTTAVAKKRPTPSVVFLADVFVIVPLTIFIGSHWR